MVSRLWLPKVHEIDIQHLLTNRSLQVVAKISTEVNKSGWSQFCTFLCPRLCRTGSRLNQEWIRNKWVIKRFLLRSIGEAAKATEWTICLLNLPKIQPFAKIEKTCDNFQVNVLTRATCFMQCPRRKLNQATGSDVQLLLKKSDISSVNGSKYGQNLAITINVFKIQAMFSSHQLVKTDVCCPTWLRRWPVW